MVAKKMPTTETSQRVQQSDEKDAGIGVGSGIRDQVLVDVKPGRVRQEAEAGRDPLRCRLACALATIS